MKKYVKLSNELTFASLANNDNSKKYFQLLDNLNKNLALKELSMGMSSDYLEAVKHGTIYLKVAALIGPIYPVFFITTAVFQAVKKPLYSLYMSVLRLTALPFFSLWYVINIRGGNYEDIFYTIFVTNWLMGIAVLMFIGYFLNNVFKQNKSFFIN